VEFADYQIYNILNNTNFNVDVSFFDCLFDGVEDRKY